MVQGMCTKKFSLYLVGAIFAVFLRPGFAATPGYSATMLEVSPDQGERAGMIYSGEHGLRTEYQSNGEKLIQIVNLTRGEVYLVNVAKQSYMRRSLVQTGAAADYTRLQSLPASPCEGQQGLVCKSLGEEKIHGRPAVKWSVSSETDKDGAGMTVWLGKQRHMPLRQQLPNGATMERKLSGTETVNQRKTEKWEISMTGPDGSSRVSYQWYDPELAVNVREEQPGVYTRNLTDIKPGPQPASLFEVPAGFSEVRAGQGNSQ